MDVSFFSVIDGHGGIEAAQWAERYIFQVALYLHIRALQGYLAHKKPPPPRNLQ